MESNLPSLLIVDDNENNLYATKLILGDFNINVHTAVSGDEALRYIFRNEYFLILMDVHMPEMDGFETVSLIKGSQEHAKIPIMFLSSINYGDRYINSFYAKGAVDYLTKPIDPIMLKNKIRAYMELKLAQIELDRLSSFDMLTGLVNRRVFRIEQERTLSLARRHDTNFAVLFLDINNFKEVNDSYGHDVGDRMLKKVAEYINGTIRDSDIVARMGGDEFAILITDIVQPGDAGTVADNILQKLKRPMVINGIRIESGGSIGIACYPTCGKTCKELNRAADLALYKAKESRQGFCFFSQPMQEQMQERLALVHGLRNVLQKNELEVYYQIKINSHTHDIIGVEALLRWNHPEQGMIEPGIFIPVAEETGAIINLGYWVLHEASAWCSRWNHDMKPEQPVRVAINVSALQLRTLGFVNLVKDVLLKYDMSPDWLELELTETAIMEDTDVAMEIIVALRELGVKITIDDFGTGYSSLSYLQQLSVDTIKIDKLFTRNIGHDEDSNKIIEAIINLAHTLDMDVVAEGVETDEQLNYLTSLGCELLQGYYFSRPVPVTELERMLFPQNSLRQRR